MELTKDLYDKLKPYEQHLIRGYKGNYTFGITRSDFDNMYKIYKDAGGQSTLRMDCGVCLLRLTKDLGMAYFSYVDEQDTIKQKKVAVKAKKGGRGAKKSTREEAK